MMMVELNFEPFRYSGQDREKVYLPKKYFTILKINEGDYISVSKDSKNKHILRAYASSVENDVIQIHETLPQVIGVKRGEKIRIEDYPGSQHIILPVYRSLNIDVGKDFCRVHPDIIKLFKIKEKGQLEIFHPQKRSRVILNAGKFDEEDKILLDRHTRTLLGLEEKNMDTSHAPEVGVRKPVHLFTNSFFDRLLKRLVGFKWLSLKVCEGNDTDEGKKIARIRNDNIQLLGLKENDVVDVQWQNQVVSCRVLQFCEKIKQERDLEAPENSCVCLCYSDRLKLNVDVGDIVRLRRSPKHFLLSNMDRVIVSGISVLGVYVTLTLQLKIDFLFSLSVSLIIGILLIWLLFAQVRSKV